MDEHRGGFESHLCKHLTLGRTKHVVNQTDSWGLGPTVGKVSPRRQMEF